MAEITRTVTLSAKEWGLVVASLELAGNRLRMSECIILQGKIMELITHV